MRTFIAVNIPERTKSEIDAIIERLRPAGPPARWVPSENVHITLKFLGEIPEDQAPAISGAIRMAITDATPFEFSLAGFGVFPNPRKARVFWIGIDSATDQFKALAKCVDLEVAKLGFEREKRAFSPHLTLARIREPGPADRLIKAASHIDYRSDSIRVDHVDLMRSVLSPKGAQYSVLKSIPLK